MRWLLLAAAVAPLILVWIVVRDHELSWARGEVTAVVGIAAFGLIFYAGVIDRPGEPSGEISLGIGWFLALLGSILMIAGAASTRGRDREATQATGGVLTSCRQSAAGPIATWPSSSSASRRPPPWPPPAGWAWATRRPPTRRPWTACTPCCTRSTWTGIVVIGEGEKDEAPMLHNGEQVGDGSPPKVDIAVDPLEGTRLTARGAPSALAVIALAERGAMFDPGPVRLHGEDGLGRGDRRSAGPRPPAGRDRQA